MNSHRVPPILDPPRPAGPTRRVLLLGPASRRTYIRDNYCSYSSKAGDFWEPVDLLYQTGFVEEAGWEPVVLDAQAERLSEAAAVERVIKARPDAVLAVTGAACWENDLRQLAAIRRALPRTVIAASADVLLEGAAALLRTTPDLDAALLDFFSDGLVRYLGARWEASLGPAVPNIVYRADGEVVAGARDGPREVRLPPPRHDLFPLRRYRLSVSGPGRFATILTSAGCNYGCPFCVGSVQRLQLRPAEEVGREIAQVRALGIRRLYFYDPNFTSSGERVRSMCAAVREAAPDARWLANAHVAVLDDEVVGLMAEAGCHTVMLGLESASDATLRLYRKGFTVAEAEAAVRRCRAAGIRVLGYFLIGLPEETEADIRRTIEFARGLGLAYASFNLPAPVPGTAMYERHFHQGAPLVVGDHSRASNIPHPTIPAEGLARLQRRAYRRFYLRPRYAAASLARALSPRGALLLARAGARLLRR